MDNPLTDPERFQAWAENPLTVAYRQYLTDFRLQLAMAWAAGSPMTEAQQSQAEVLGDLSDLKVADVRAFYNLDEVKRDDE
jgi:hypothetical protein